MSTLIPRTRDLPKHDSNGRPYTAQEMNDMEAERVHDGRNEDGSRNGCGCRKLHE